MDYIPGTLIDVDEETRMQEPIPHQSCRRCGEYMGQSYEGWICYDCYTNYRDWAVSYGLPTRAGVERAEREWKS